MRVRVRAFWLALTALASLPASALAHEGDPNFRSAVRAIEPAAPGVSAQVLNYDDSLQLDNRGDWVVIVEGYEGEPYVRISPDGTVEVNTRSPAHYLNDDRYAQTEVPAHADAEAPPRWELVDRSGQYAWHDHRIHYMSRGVPPQVRDESERTHVFDWKVPLRVDGKPVAVRGELVWVGVPEGTPLLPFVLLAALAAGAGALAFVRARRRRGGERREAW
jgi:hypothetical protein